MPISVQLCTFLDINKEDGFMRVPCQKYSGREGAEKELACGVVKTSMYISPQGKVLPCMTLGGTAIDAQFDSMLEKDLSEILKASHYRDICNVKMGDCIRYNEKCHDCKYRLKCGAGCRACGCGETGTDYMAIDEECCSFYLNGWYEKALEMIGKYQDRLPKRQSGAQRKETDREEDIC